MRILHSISSVDPQAGGPIEGIKQIAAASHAAGHHIEILCLDDPAAPWVDACPLPVHAIGPAYGRYGYAPGLQTWLRQHHHEYDVIIINGLWQYSSFGVWRALRKTSTPYFVFTHGMLDPWFKRTYPLKHLKKWLYWPWAEYRVLRDAAAVLFTCEEERRLASQSFSLYRCNEYIVRYGTSAPTGNPELQKQAFLARYPQLADKHCLLFLGRVHPKKGPDLLLKALAKSLAENHDGQTRLPHLIMAGPAEDDYGREMKNLAQSLGLEPFVTWTGMIAGDMKWGAFHAASAFVLPSHQENFGIAVAEAMACALPVLISNKVNIWREIAECNAGWVADDDDQGTGELLGQWLAASDDELQAMGNAGKQCFDTHFHITETVRTLHNAFHQYGHLQAPKLA